MIIKLLTALLLTILLSTCATLKYERVEVPARMELLIGEPTDAGYGVSVKNPLNFPLLLEIRYAADGRVAHKILLPARRERRHMMAANERMYLLNGSNGAVSAKVAPLNGGELPAPEK